MDKNKTSVSHLDKNLKNDPETNDKELSIDIKETIAKNKEIIEKNREVLKNLT